MTGVTPEPAFKGPRSIGMTHVSDAAPVAANEDDGIVGGAWLGPAVGASILAVVWAAYLVFVLYDIFAVG